jgi:hypothetical protein
MDRTEQSLAQRFWMREVVGETWFLVPAQRSWAAIVFLTLWLIGWAVGEFFAIGALVSILTGQTNLGAGGLGGALFLLVWVGFWTFGGLMALFEWLWNLSGREAVGLNGDRLRIEQRVPGWTRGRDFRLAQIRDLRLAERLDDLPMGRLTDAMGAGQTALHFTYGEGGQAVTFAAGLDGDNARILLEEIAVRQPAIVAAEFFRDYEPPAAKL